MTVRPSTRGAARRRSARTTPDRLASSPWLPGAQGDAPLWRTEAHGSRHRCGQFPAAFSARRAAQYFPHPLGHGPALLLGHRALVPADRLDRLLAAAPGSRRGSSFNRLDGDELALERALLGGSVALVVGNRHTEQLVDACPQGETDRPRPAGGSRSRCTGSADRRTACRPRQCARCANESMPTPAGPTENVMDAINRVRIDGKAVVWRRSP